MTASARSPCTTRTSAASIAAASLKLALAVVVEPLRSPFRGVHRRGLVEASACPSAPPSTKRTFRGTGDAIKYAKDIDGNYLSAALSAAASLKRPETQDIDAGVCAHLFRGVTAAASLKHGEVEHGILDASRVIRG